MNLPSGTVTFLFTDIEGSSQLWEKHATVMRAAVARHDELLQAAVVANRGHVVKMRGDGLHAVFASVLDAVAAAVAGQKALQDEAWDEALGRMPVRMGIHSGSAQLRDGDYFGAPVNRAARLQDAGHGGQILLSQVAAGLIGDQLPAGISLLDLGRYQIKDFPAPEHVFQVLAPPLPDRFPPLRAAGGRRTNLPPQTTTFVGREREKIAAKQLLEQARLVTLTGPGGTGKTRLSLQVGTELSGRYRDGVWLVELAPLTDEAMVLPAIAEVFALQPEPQRPLAVVLTDFLRDKTMLLLLDNCEHLIDTCAVLAGSLLEDAVDLRILASSREALGVPGEMVLRVPSLTVPAPDEKAAEALLQAEAVQLLVERARTVRRDFQVTDENAAAVAEICRRLDGIPLAIELAASRLRLFSPQELAARLNDRFRLLTGGSRTVLPRQQTLQALIDWSYELLSEEEQALFRRLAVFVNGWTFAAAEAVGTGLDILELLDQLVNKSLVQPEQTAAGTRFRYLETIRQYARERLFAAGEGEAARDQHFAYFAALVAAQVEAFDGPRRDDVRRTLVPEVDNFRQALEWAISRDTVAALDMLAGVVYFIMTDTGWGDFYAAVTARDVRGWLEGAATSLAAHGSEERGEYRRAWAQIYLITSQTAISTGEFTLAQQQATKAIAIARALGDEKMLMAALGFYAVPANAQQAWDEAAIAAAEESLALARKLGNSYYRSSALSVLAGYESNRGNEATARAYLAEVARSGAFLSALAMFQTGILNVIHNPDDMSRALPYFEESRRLFEGLGNRLFVANATSQMGHVLRHSGDLDAAEAIYRESLPTFHWQGHRSAIAHELECLAFIARQRHAPERAARLLGAAAALRERIAVPMLNEEQVEYDQELTALKQTLDGKAFEEAWLAGSFMTVDEAVGYALAGSAPGEDAGLPDFDSYAAL